MSDWVASICDSKSHKYLLPKGNKYYYFFTVYIVMMNNYYRTDRVPNADERINAV